MAAKEHCISGNGQEYAGDEISDIVLLGEQSGQRDQRGAEYCDVPESTMHPVAGQR